ncbi:MAG: flavodoxin family protein, partial [Planctomycetota bacterium]|nr:flavodoxin family protein [Planctomycetota bacterium]
MKVAIINGSPRKNGNTFTALSAAEEALRARGIGTEWIEAAGESIRGCSGCGVCGIRKNRRCAFDDDCVNRHLEALIAADGMLI